MMIMMNTIPFALMILNNPAVITRLVVLMIVNVF